MEKYDQSFADAEALLNREFPLSRSMDDEQILDAVAHLVKSKVKDHSSWLLAKALKRLFYMKKEGGREQ